MESEFQMKAGKFYSKNSLAILQQSMENTKDVTTEIPQIICPFCYKQDFDLDEHFKKCTQYKSALEEPKCRLCNETLVQGQNKWLHWKNNCKVVNMMKESGKNIFMFVVDVSLFYIVSNSK